ncbi:MAG: hemerythrin family protein [Rhodospirillaceae bacterium]
MPATKKQNKLPTPLEFIARCDMEHAILQRLYADLIVAYNRQFRGKATEKILRILSMYVKFHFANEELYMEAIHYPEQKHHTQSHTSFAIELSVIKSLFQKGDDVYDHIRKLYTSLAQGHIPEDEKLQEYVQCLSPDV